MRRTPLPPELYHTLAQHGLGSLPPQQAYLHVYEAGEYISREGELLDCVQFIIKGKVKVSVSSPEGRTLLFCFDTPGDIIGSIELFGDQIATANGECIVATEAIGVPIEANLDFFSTDVDFLYYLCCDLSAAFAASSRNAAGNVLYSLETRLSSYIVMMQRDGIFRDKLVDTAELLGASYRHLLRVFHNFCKMGVLGKEGRSYRILQPEQLEAIGEGYYLSPRHGSDGAYPRSQSG